MASMHWDDVRYFLVLARRGSLSASARALGVEHSTISRRVSGLERSLNVRLFDRLPRGWRLTLEGTELLQGALRLEEEVLAFERSAFGRGPEAGKVRISAPPQLVTHLVLPHLGALRDGHPELDFEVIGERREVNLDRGEAELALRIGSPGAHPELISHSLGPIGYGFYGTGRELRRASADQRFVGFDDSVPGLPQKRWLDELAGTRRVILRANDLLTMHRAAVDGWGIALLPHFLVREEDPLSLLPVAGPPLERPLSLLIHPEVRRSPRVRVVSQFLRELGRAQSTWLRRGGAPGAYARGRR